MLTIIGCGNLNRGDDGVGVRIAQKLAERLRKHPVPGVQVFDCGTAGVDVMFRARGSTALIIIDAATAGAEPGAIYEVPGEELAREHEPTYSLHDFRWDNALAAGRKIFKKDFPEDVSVWLVQAQSLDYGLELSTPVSQAAERVYERLLGRIADFARQQGDAPQGLTPDQLRLEIVRGGLRIPKAVYDRYFQGREGALLMERDGRILVVPVEQVTGGLLVKQRNLHGDRVIVASELLSEHGADGFEGEVSLGWDSELGALCFDLDVLKS